MASRGNRRRTPAIKDIRWTPHEFDLNDAGDFMYVAHMSDPASALIVKNSSVMAAIGMDSPVPGRLWDGGLYYPGLGLNNPGDYVLCSTIAGDEASDSLVVKNGTVVRREGLDPQLWRERDG